jgi:hypothetical protein
MTCTRTLAVLLLLLPTVSYAQNPISFTDKEWELSGDAKVGTTDGRATISAGIGDAIFKGMRLKDGTIDVDIKTTTLRSFVYVMFRIQSDGELEDFYLRPHKSGLTDAAQYAPVYQGQSAWQLYYGERGTAAPEITPNVWTPLRIVLSGRRAAFFLGDTLKPFMVINRLAREPADGFVALRSFVPPPLKAWGAQFSNLRIRPGVIAYDFPSPPADPPAITGLIQKWMVGKAFAAPDSAISILNPAWLAEMKSVELEPEGFVELHRHLSIPTNARYWGTVARTTINAAHSMTKRLDLGFSDRITVFLNGKPIFYRDDSYDYDMRRDGLLSLKQASVYLPLNAGANDLSIVVTDRFGGWAIMGAIPDSSGLR